jgi:cobalt-zinc-cadmium efflux system outer membrane protein
MEGKMAWRKFISTGVLVTAFGSAAPPAFPQDPPPSGEFAVDPRTTEVLPPTVLGGRPVAAPAAPAEYTLDQLVRLALENNPRLAQAAVAIDAARGRALQAGLYPNPTVSFVGDELGDRQGRAGILTVPQISQEIVTGGKLTLSRAAAEREVDQATLALAARRADLLAGVRTAYFDVLTLQLRTELLGRLRALTQQSVEQTRQLVERRQATRLDVVQLEVEAERIRAEAEAADQEMPAAFRRLAAAVGVRDLPERPLAGRVESPLPNYELDRVRQYVVGVHPEVRSAQAGVERARLLYQRAQAEPIPNVTVSGGYVRQNQNESNDFMVGVSLPVPVWNRNQGNIQAALAEAASATREVQRVENDLTDRVAAAFRDYAAARRRAERLAGVRAKADEAFRLIAEEKNFNFTTVQRLVAQQAVIQATLEQLRARGDAWRAASTLSGLTLEEQWPPAGTPRDGPKP